jgi:hypothetical protein
VTILDEVQTEAWHILTSIYTHQRMVEAIPKCLTRYDLANQLVALNALAEILVIRIARLADRRKETRSISMLLKRGNFSAPIDAISEAGERFILLAEPVVKIRHEQIAHMKPGTLSSFEPQSLSVEVLRATESLVKLIDTARGKVVAYTYKVGSAEAKIDLRASLMSGSMVTA